MAKLTKEEAKSHVLAEELAQKESLTYAEKLFVLENWQESAHNVNTLSGAFFTPFGLAIEFALEANFYQDCRIIDLCAGIGTLSLAILDKHRFRENEIEIVCVEKNPEYVALGKKIIPEATWIEADIFDLPDLGRFDMAISNPPFGKLKVDGKPTRYKGSEFDYKVIDIASQLADCGAFILPQGSCPFRYSGTGGYTRSDPQKYKKFHKETGIHLDIGAGVDTSVFRDQWHGTSPSVEIVTCEF